MSERISGQMHRLRGLALRCLALSLAVAGALWVAGPAAAAAVAFTISDPRIAQSSGLARDVAGRRYWTVTGSDAAAVAYAINPAGKVVGSVHFRASPQDLQAVAVLGSRLYLADIGDSAGNRAFVTVYVLTDPPSDGATVTYNAYDLTYPDGNHDAATLLVDNTGRLYIVTKGDPGAIYAAPGLLSRRSLNRLVRVGTAPAYVTDGVFLPGDQRIALRTYVSVQVLDAISYKVVAQAATPKQSQGESIAVSLDGRSLLIGNARLPGAVYRMPVPRTVGRVPTAPATPPGDATSSPAPGQSEDDQTDVPATSVSRRGTMLALGLAGVVAVVAGVVVAVVRRP